MNNNNYETATNLEIKEHAKESNPSNPTFVPEPEPEDVLNEIIETQPAFEKEMEAKRAKWDREEKLRKEIPQMPNTKGYVSRELSQADYDAIKQPKMTNSEAQEARNQKSFNMSSAAHARYMMGRKQAAEANPYSFSPQERAAYLNWDPQAANLQWKEALKFQEEAAMAKANQYTQQAIERNEIIKGAEEKAQAKYDASVCDNISASYYDMIKRGKVQTNRNDKKTYKVGYVSAGAISAANSYLGNGRDKLHKIVCYQPCDAKGETYGDPAFLITFQKKDGTKYTQTMNIQQVMTTMKDTQMKMGHNEMSATNYAKSAFDFDYNPLGWQKENYYNKEQLDYDLNNTRENNRHNEAGRVNNLNDLKESNRHSEARQVNDINERKESNRHDEAEQVNNLNDTRERNRHNEAESARSEGARQFDVNTKQRELDREIEKRRVAITERQAEADIEIKYSKDDLEWEKFAHEIEKFDKTFELSKSQFDQNLKLEYEKLKKSMTSGSLNLKETMTFLSNMLTPNEKYGHNRDRTALRPIDLLSPEQQAQFFSLFDVVMGATAQAQASNSTTKASNSASQASKDGQTYKPGQKITHNGKTYIINEKGQAILQQK